MSKAEKSDIQAFRTLACTILIFFIVGAVIFILGTLVLNQPLGSSGYYPYKLTSPPLLAKLQSWFNGNSLNRYYPSSYSISSYPQPLYKNAMNNDLTLATRYVEMHPQHGVNQVAGINHKASGLPYIKKLDDEKDKKDEMMMKAESLEEENDIENGDYDNDKEEENESFWSSLLGAITRKKIEYKKKEVFKIRGKGECKVCNLH